MNMKRLYIIPITESIEVYERYGVLEKENSGVAGGEISFGKQNDLFWDEDIATNNLWDDNNLWGDEEE